MAPAGIWPSVHGPAGQTSRLGEALTGDEWRVLWYTPLGEIGAPVSVLAGAGGLVVNGRRKRAYLRATDGAVLRVEPGPTGGEWLDAPGARLLGNDRVDLSTHLLPSGERDSTILLLFPATHRAVQTLEGPGLLVFRSELVMPHADREETVVESFLVRDYGAKGGEDILYGLSSRGGISRPEHGVHMAASQFGPVLATREGVRFCDWHLFTRSDIHLSQTPIALSVDREQRAYLVFARDGVPWLGVFSFDAGLILEVELAVAAPVMSPALIAESGMIAIAPPYHLTLLEADGRVLLDEERPSPAPVTMTSNGILLVPHHDLLAVTPEGRRFPLFRPPAPIVSAPFIAGGVLHVATADALYALVSH